MPSADNTRMPEVYSSPGAGHGQSCGMSMDAVRLVATLVMRLRDDEDGCHSASYRAGSVSNSSKQGLAVSY